MSEKIKHKKKRIRRRCHRDKYRFKFINKSKKLYVFLLTGFIFLFICFIFVFNNFFIPNIVLKGHKNMTIHYNDKYIESGYNVIKNGKKINRKVVIKGSVNSKKLGKYTITYYIRNNYFSKKVKRNIKVIDNEAPNINIDKNSNIYVCPGKKYILKKYSAIDNYDGDITDKVKVTKTKDSVKYSVVDSSGNKNIISKKIIYEDNIKPSIEMVGGAFSYFFIGDNYSDPGYKAFDNCDGDITDSVTISGKVNTSTSGTYTIKYSVKDKSNNINSVERTVIVSEHGQKGTIYLTFDDGPKDGTTNVILDILKQENVKATFFVTNGGSDSLIKREYDEGHTVALHTASHNYSLIYSSVDNYYNDLYTVFNRVKSITGYESHIIRFPGGSSNTVSRHYSIGIMSKLTTNVLEKGFKYYDWNISSGDAEVGQHSANEIYNNVTKKLSHDRSNIVLMHDINNYTKDALKSIIKYGKENGYTFEAITDKTEMMTQRVNN